MNIDINQGTSVVSRVRVILQAIAANRMDISSFLHALSYRDEACTLDPTIRGARHKLLNSELLSGIL